MRYFRYGTIIVVLICIVVLLSSTALASGITLNPSDWVNVQLPEIIQNLTEKEYQRTGSSDNPDNPQNPYLIFSSSENNPIMAYIYYDSESFFTNSVNFIYSPDAYIAQHIYDTFTAFYGVPLDTPATENSGEIMEWKTSSYSIILSIAGTYAQAKNGVSQYALLFREVEANLASSTNNVTEAPTSTTTITSDVLVVSAYLERNSAGTDQAFVVLKNNSQSAVDRVDIYIKCFDAYGNQIYGYGTYDVSSCFYDETILPGKCTPSGIYWGLYGFKGTKKIDVAVTSYHTTSGQTVRIPEDQLVWKTFR